MFPQGTRVQRTRRGTASESCGLLLVAVLGVCRVPCTRHGILLSLQEDHLDSGAEAFRFLFSICSTSSSCLCKNPKIAREAIQ